MIRRYFEYIILNFPIFIFIMILGEDRESVKPAAVLIVLMQLLIFIGLAVRQKGFSIFITIVSLITIFAFMLYAEGIKEGYMIPLTLALMLMISSISMLLKDKYTPFFYLIVTAIAIGVAVYLQIDFLNVTAGSVIFYETLACIGILICNTYGCMEIKEEKPRIRIKTEN